MRAVHGAMLLVAGIGIMSGCKLLQSPEVKTVLRPIAVGIVEGSCIALGDVTGIEQVFIDAACSAAEAEVQRVLAAKRAVRDGGDTDATLER